MVNFVAFALLYNVIQQFAVLRFFVVFEAYMMEWTLLGLVWTTKHCDKRHR